MNSGTLLGKASISFSRPVYIQSCASVVGPKEGDGPLKNCFDMICDDPMFGEKKWEAAESAMQKRPLFLRSEKPVLHRMIFDLSSLVTCSPRPLLLPLVLQKWEFHSSVCMVPALQWENHSLLELSPYLPDMGITFSVPPPAILPLPKRISFSSWLRLSAPSFRYLDCYRKRCLYSQSRYHPSEIAGSSLLRSTLGSVAITGITTGKVIDFGFRDSLNMGGCMAPAACDTIYRHFEDFGRSVNDYDAVLTGDLGVVGRQILLDLLKEKI